MDDTNPIISTESSETGMELQGGATRHKVVRNSISSIGCKAKAAECRPIPDCHDGNPSSGYRVGRAIHDSKGMQSASES